MILTGEHEYKSARGTRAAQSVKRSTLAKSDSYRLSHQLLILRENNNNNNNNNP